MATPAPTLIPASKPPPGVTSDFANPASLAYRANIAIGISVGLTTTLFSLRTYVRIWIKRTWILEDWLAFTAWAGTVSYCGIMGATMAHYGGKHIWDITLPQAHESAYWFNVASIQYGVIICMTKLAILALYRRVFSPRRFSPFDMTIMVLIVIIILFYGSSGLVKIFECTPRAKIFNSSVKGTCVDTSMLLNTSGCFNTITDFLILFLPIKAVWDLNMSKQKKLIVVLVFTFGLCAPIFSLIGFIVRIRDSSNPDTSWNQLEMLLWGTAELTAGNLCVSFPELGALLRIRQRKSGPSTSILNGDYKRSRIHRQANRDIAKGSLPSADDGSYLELDDHPELGTVRVTHEIRIDSDEVAMRDVRES